MKDKQKDGHTCETRDRQTNRKRIHGHRRHEIEDSANNTNTPEPNVKIPRRSMRGISLGLGTKDVRSRKAQFLSTEGGGGTGGWVGGRVLQIQATRLTDMVGLLGRKM